MVVHVETLGEYPTTIRHLRIVEASSGRVVLDLVAKAEYANTGATQTRNFSLVSGKNSTHLLKPGIDSYEVRVPESGRTFNLQPGVAYRLKAWNGSWIASQTKFSF
ncbi:MAG TPA: hypothetical protein VKB38_20815 [Terracidiphilus sp.]|nr:hypothetical protein [Terracidiphilus sp.]